MSKISLLGFVLALFLFFSFFVLAIWNRAPEKELANRWQEHVEKCQQIELATYKKDRARIVSGSVLDQNGMPIKGARIRVLDNAKLWRLSRNSIKKFLSTKFPIEFEATTDEKGNYRMEDLSVGAKTFFVDQTGFKPRSLPHKVIMEGYGSRVDVRLKKLSSGPEMVVKIDKKQTALKKSKLWFLPNEWWPEFKSLEIKDAESIRVDLSMLPGDSGLVLTEAGETGKWSFIGTYDKKKFQPFSKEIRVSSQLNGNLLADLKTAKNDIISCLHNSFQELGLGKNIWCNSEMNFWSSVSPVCLLLAQEKIFFSSKPSAMVEGFTATPYSPVICKSENGEQRVVISDQASEFRIPVASTGAFRVRTMGWDGVSTFHNGVFVKKNSRAQTRFSRYAVWNYEKEKPCVVSGFVKSKGSIRPGATVVMQDASNFRYFLERKVSDQNGYFKFENVPSGRQYFVFASPENQENSLRHFSYFSTSEELEKIVDLEIFSNHIFIKPPVGYNGNLSLRNLDQNIVVWNGQIDLKASKTISNVQPGRYLFELGDDASAMVQSEVTKEFVVKKDSLLNSVPWKESIPKNVR